jgi:hypothetical protein
MVDLFGPWFLIWRELPDRLSLLGILILVSAGLYTFYRQQQLRRLRTRQDGAHKP